MRWRLQKKFITSLNIKNQRILQNQCWSFERRVLLVMFVRATACRRRWWCRRSTRFRSRWHRCYFRKNNNNNNKRVFDWCTVSRWSFHWRRNDRRFRSSISSAIMCKLSLFCFRQIRERNKRKIPINLLLIEIVITFEPLKNNND